MDKVDSYVKTILDCLKKCVDKNIKKHGSSYYYDKDIFTKYIISSSDYKEIGDEIRPIIVRMVDMEYDYILTKDYCYYLASIVVKECEFSLLKMCLTNWMNLIANSTGPEIKRDVKEFYLHLLGMYSYEEDIYQECISNMKKTNRDYLNLALNYIDQIRQTYGIDASECSCNLIANIYQYCLSNRKMDSYTSSLNFFMDIFPHLVNCFEIKRIESIIEGIYSRILYYCFINNKLRFLEEILIKFFRNIEKVMSRCRINGISENDDYFDLIIEEEIEENFSK